MAGDSLTPLNSRRSRKRWTVGRPPGTIVADPNAPKPIMTVIAYGPDAFEEKRVASVSEIEAFLGRFPVTWLNVDGLGDASTIEAVGKLFQLHALALEDVVNVRQRPKAESYGTYEFIVAQMINGHCAADQEQLGLFLGKRFVVTFQEFPGDCFDPIRERMRKGQGLLRQLGPDYLAYALLDRLVDSYFPVLEYYGEQLDALEDRSLMGAVTTSVRDLHRIKRELFNFRRAVWPLRDAFNGLMRDTAPFLSDETRLHLRDAYDHVVQMIDLLETYRELSSDLIDLHLSTVNNRMNEVMRVLTIISTIFIPTTFIASIYGMNFKFIPELDWRYGYFYALAAMAAVAVAMLAFFWRKGWLRSFFPSSAAQTAAPAIRKPEPTAPPKTAGARLTDRRADCREKIRIRLSRKIETRLVRVFIRSSDTQGGRDEGATDHDEL